MSGSLFRGLTVGLLSILVFPALAGSPASNWSVHTWKSDDGLPNNQVTGMAQTPDGYLWVSTYSRLARFDGVHFEEFSLREFGLAANQKITALELRRDGGLWMGTSHGQIISVTPQAVRIFTNSLPDLMVLTLTEDADGSLWVTYPGGGTCRFKDGQATPFTAADGFPPGGNRDAHVCSVTRDRDGRIWFGKNGVAGMVRNKRFESLLNLPPITMCLAGRRAGGVWICSGGQLMKYEGGKTPERAPSLHPLPAAMEPTALLEDRDGGLWIGTAQRGLFHYDGSDFESVPASDDGITSLAQDREGNVWVGTLSGGLDRVRPRVVELETMEDGLPAGPMLSVCEDTARTLWATSQNGLLARREEGRWRTVSTNENWPGGRATCVAADRAGVVWVGTRDRALYRWQDGRFTSWLPRDGLAGREIHTLLISKTGDLWIGEGTPDVVQRLHNGLLESFQLPPNIRVIRAMAEDADGNVWAGTSAGMLIRIHDGKVIDETGRTTGEPSSIRCLHASPDGGLWIGYADEGVGWLKNGRFAHFTAEKDFPEENVSQIVPDNLGWLWFAGDHGIFKVPQRELEELGTGQTIDLNDIHFGQSEGLSGLEASCGASPGAIRDMGGSLWIPMRNALAVVHLDRIQEDPEPPSVRLKRIIVDDQTVASYGGAVPVTKAVDLQSPAAALRLPPGYHRLEFDFTALSFGAPENIRFRYRLEGFDEHWTEGTQRSASYSRLAAGDYRFSVKACNSHGIWNERGTSLALTVVPFVWQTWWFRCVGVAVFTVLLVAILRYVTFRRLHLKLETLERQAALDKERARIARDIHDNLGSYLTEIVMLSEFALHDGSEPEKVGRHLQETLATARLGIKSLDETVWAVNPRNDTLPHLIDYVGHFAVQFLQKAGIRSHMELPEHPPVLPVSADARHNVFLVMKEALNNVARHAGATEVRLSMDAREASLDITVEDNGRGFREAPDDPCADGLRNMRQRMKEIGGRFQIESVPGSGTRIWLRLPL